MKIFMLIPFDSAFNDISELVRETVISDNHEIIRADEISNTGIIVDQIQREIEKSDFIIADVSGKNPNVMYELGLAQSLKKPILPIIHLGEEIPFDIASFRTIMYDRNRLIETLVTPLRKLLASMNIDLSLENLTKEYKKEKELRKTIFVSYSHVDTKYLDRLKIHLKPFEKNELIDLWADTKIKAGEKWKEKIEKALSKSVMAILMISADFLASDFIIDNELPPLLKSAEEKGKIILPVILRPCRFTKDENLSKFQSINDPKFPLSKMDENEEEEIYVKIADYVDDLVR
jgi:hypothetical protein